MIFSIIMFKTGNHLAWFSKGTHTFRKMYSGFQLTLHSIFSVYAIYFDCLEFCEAFLPHQNTKVNQKY